GKTSVKCILCDDAKQVELKQLAQHIHTHLEYFPYKCNVCDYKGIHKREIDDHGYLNHDEPSFTKVEGEAFMNSTTSHRSKAQKNPKWFAEIDKNGDGVIQPGEFDISLA
ncbi:hypothetical protein PENTCL1PPCAC_19226, partial [Pristionchus entomophagus]